MRAYLIVFGFLFLFVAPATAQSFEERQAASLVEDMAFEVFSSVRGGSEGQRADRFVPIIQKYVEIDAVAQNALGAIWDELTPSQRSDFAQIYTDMIADYYATLLAGSVNGRFQLRDTLKLTGGLIRVRGEAIVSDRKVPVGFIVGSGFQSGIRNIVIDDVAFVEQDREIFLATWEAAGGDYHSFISALQSGFQ